MKEFKKWLHNYSHGELISQRYELSDAWKAALEWALGEIYMSSAIKEELEDAKT